MNVKELSILIDGAKKDMREVKLIDNTSDEIESDQDDEGVPEPLPVINFNPYHGKDGKFTGKGGGASGPAMSPDSGGGSGGGVSEKHPISDKLLKEYIKTRYNMRVGKLGPMGEYPSGNSVLISKSGNITKVERAFDNSPRETKLGTVKEFKDRLEGHLKSGLIKLYDNGTLGYTKTRKEGRTED